MVEFFLRIERFTSRMALVAAVLMLVVSVTMGFYQVLTRFVFDAPSTWSEVMARSTMIWCVFLGAAASFRGGYMMAVEVIYKLVPRRRLILVESLIALCCIISLVVLIYFGTAMTWRVRSQVLSGLGISISWAYAAIPIGAGFSLLAVLARLLAQATGREPVGIADADMPSAHDRQPVAEPSLATPSEPESPAVSNSSRLTRRARS
ncbi:TRAP transporter small permease [Litchfieldella rifensis]|uniref:TRAP transporter small permease protein n=1 Tax=Litchfieldella rifensis TaxID=762643 RepID=A0ABV7LU84_9GAMM